MSSLLGIGEETSNAAREMFKKRCEEIMVAKKEKREKCEESLLFFVRTMWKYVEPSTEFVDTWHIAAICMHLEQVTYGNIKRLLINVPPGMMKSLLVDVFWPAWEWIHDPTHRYLCTSYSQSLTERDNIRFRNVVMSEEYQSMWGDKFGPSKDSFSVVKVANDKTGWKLATSTGGTGTGERGSRVLCFGYDELVATEKGTMRIGDIVEKNINVRAWSYNETTGKMELRRITKKFKNPSAPLLKITMEDGTSIKCTYDHKIRSSWGYMPAKNLVAGNLLLAAPSRMQFASLNVSTFTGWKIKVRPNSAVSYARNRSSAYSKFFTKGFRSFLPSGMDFPNHFCRKVGRAVFESPMFLAIVNILKPCPILNIREGRIASSSVFMPNFLSLWAWPDKGRRYKSMNHNIEGFPIFSKSYPWVSISKNWLKNFSRNPMVFPISISNGARDAADDPSRGNSISSLESDHITPFFLRVVNIEHVYEIPPSTYCLTVEGNHNLCCGDVSSIICSNCDDPHNVKDGESDLVRRSTLQYFTEVLPTRLVSPVDSAIIVIMQRVNEEDVSGYIIANQLGYVHLMLPMRFDSSRKCITYLPDDDEIFFEDPRTEDGELLSPVRSPEWAVVRDEKVMGSYAVAGQFQQMPTPRGGGIIKDKYWKLYPEYQEVMDDDGKPVVPLEYPAMEFIIASLDSAYTAKEENDYSALTVWGVWRKDGAPKVMLMAGWKERLELNALVNKVNDTCSRPKGIPVDRLLIENKASGKSVAQEIIRLFDAADFGVEMVEPKGDKISRMHSIQHLFENGVVYAPDRAWAQMVIDDTSKFPKGAHDDIPDSVSCALKWLRDSGFALRTDEYDTAELESRMLTKPTLPLYDC